MHVQNVRDFPQAKLDSEINYSFLLNEHGDPVFFLPVFAKNSLIRTYLKKKKSLIEEHDFLGEIVPNWAYSGQGEDFNLTAELSDKYNIPSTKLSKTA